MGGLAPLLASLVAVDVKSFAQRLRRNTLLYAFAALFLLTAYGAAIAAFAIWLSSRMTPVQALGIVAIIALALSFLMFTVVMVANRAEERRRRETASGSKALMLTAALSALPLLMKSRPLMAASVTGGLALLALRLLGGRDQDDSNV